MKIKSKMISVSVLLVAFLFLSVSPALGSTYVSFPTFSSYSRYNGLTGSTSADLNGRFHMSSDAFQLFDDNLDFQWADDYAQITWSKSLGYIVGPKEIQAGVFLDVFVDYLQVHQYNEPLKVELWLKLYKDSTYQRQLYTSWNAPACTVSPPAVCAEYDQLVSIHQVMGDSDWSVSSGSYRIDLIVRFTTGFTQWAYGYVVRYTELWTSPTASDGNGGWVSGFVVIEEPSGCFVFRGRIIC